MTLTRMLLLPALLSILLAMPVHSLAATAGQVVVAKGSVQATRDATTLALQRRDQVLEQDKLTTGEDSRTQLRFVDGALLTLNEHAELFIDEYSYQNEGRSDRVLLKLVKGGFRTLTGAIGKTDRNAYQVDTPLASIGIRGTLYSVRYNAASELLEVIVLKGVVVVFNELGSATIQAQPQPGQAAASGAGTRTDGTQRPHNAVRVRRDRAPEPYTTTTENTGTPELPGTFEVPGDPDDSGQSPAEETQDGDSDFATSIEQPSPPPAPPVGL